MTMTFSPGWAAPKIAPVPVLPPNPSNKKIKNRDYIIKNNQKRQDGALFLTFFDETAVRNAVQRAVPKYNSADGTIKGLLNDMIGSAETITIDQGTHQVEDQDSGGFKLHFDARPASGSPCFHLYVQQSKAGYLIISEVSYMNGGTRVDATPSA
ncbi:hypothetical protein [Sulfitobacter sabulilitoris]|uniref:Uncharacterized protein n=1 Tax=Sulfitobacter sabulilitoris TaxID=2562655 RepID=A0A5S3PIL7_9RHOB|nr:hypothetical protein [Sulfitobacter sabulilitoris]TMM54146.1 hypothetical protein FDT80_00640 [Sulfitobacter sabulilitoris]